MSKLAAKQWAIPAYAQGNLWLADENSSVQPQGPQGDFTYQGEADALIVRWGRSDGPGLVRLERQADTLGWDGRVGIGGYIDAMHMRMFGDEAVNLLYLGGQPLTQSYPPVASGAFMPPDFHKGLVHEVADGVTTWLALTESPLAATANDAMLNGLRIYVYGRLADDDSGWGSVFALPLVLEAITIFA